MSNDAYYREVDRTARRIVDDLRTSHNRTTMVFTTDRGKFRGDVLPRVRQIMRGEDAPLVDGPDD